MPAVSKNLVLFSPFERRALAQNTLAGFDGWLVKPVRSASLIARLNADAIPLPLPQADDVATGAPMRGLNVLLVEDNAINALVARKHLERFGASVVHATDGIEAVDMASRALRGDRAPFDIVLMDIRMPGLDGLDASRWIRRLERENGTPSMRIVALTANAFEEDRRAAIDAGIDDFLTKPVDPERLLAALAPQRAVA